MLRTSSPWRKRPRGRFVLKYLEGIPTPTKLVDHIAGADLSSSSWTDFLTTVPRYINAQHEQRLSKLFFHHVLYPAGGARRPFQAVVVRGGRLTAPSPVVLTNTSSRESSAPPRSVKAMRDAKDPLAVPEAWQHTRSAASSAADALPEGVTATAQQWARADPARQPYFFSAASPSVKASTTAGSTSRGGHGGRFGFEMGGPRFSTWHPPASSASSIAASSLSPPSRAPSQPVAPLVEGHRRRARARDKPTESAGLGAEAAERLTTDEAFRGLQGVVEAYWKAIIQQDALESSHKAVVEALRQCQVNDSAGLLAFDTVLRDAMPYATTAHTVVCGSVPSTPAAADAVLSTVVRAALTDPPSARAAQPRARHVYLQTQLPSAAFAHVHMDNTSSSASVRATRVAGGVVPHVSFAVGQPITRVSPGCADEKVSSAFAHLTAIVRVQIEPHATTTSLAVPTSAPPAAMTRAGTQEPWRLGHSLDPAVPVVTRTATERTDAVYLHVDRTTDGGRESTVSAVVGHPSGLSAVKDGEGTLYECVLGRHDAESYLVPQRELVLELLVPGETHLLCQRQNRARVARQSRLGHHSGPHTRASLDGEADDSSMVWPAHQRPTAARVAQGRERNMAEASGVDRPRDAVGSPAPPHIMYEVRALPGDVVYIPRGWGYRLKRIVGSAAVCPSSLAHPCTTPDVRRMTPSTSAAVAAASASGLPPVNASPATADALAQSAAARVTAPAPEVSERAPPDMSAAAHLGRLSSIEVDAWCVVYEPYPDLTEDQASTYVPANYVHHGVDEFYRNGGNSVYHAYK